ncbi:importin subunit alpha-7-like [Drosophila tropicalis]|uniref:importin subunit alpha-7-like n=1 Tax=Drosophila tropicalis TaxID=46794 RepID=UPI0035ABA65A
MIHKHLMERFVEILKNNTDNTLHSEVISMLNNIASNSPHQIAILTDSGAVPVFLGLLSSSYHKVQEDAMWALGNIAFESLMNRDLLLDSGIMVPLLHLLSSCPNVSVIRRSVWTFANLARWRNPPLDSTQISQSMFILQGLLQHKDPDILVDACLTVCYLSNEREQVQAVVDADICRHLVKLLVHPDRGVCTAALRAVGNVFHGTDEQIQVVLDLDALPCISQLMHYSSCIIRKEACRSIANIATGSSAQIQKIIDANIFPQMLKMIKTADSKTSKEIIRSLANASTFGKSNQTHYLFLINSLPLVCDFLTIDDSSVILLALKTLENILRVGDDYQILPNPYALAIEECGGLEKIEYLQTHENLEIYHKSFNLIDQFFEDEDDDMRMHPVAGIDQFEFSAQNLPEGSFDF